MARVRLGVALLVPSPVSQEIDGLRRALGDPALERIPAHLTLVPPVNVAERDLADAVEVLSQAGSSTRPFRVTMGPPATFMPDNPVIYLPVNGESAAALERLRALVLLAPLARTLTWPFVPHVTLFDGADPARIDAALGILDQYTAEVTFEAVHLLREAAGRVWEPVADFAFAARSVIGRGGLPIELSVGDGLDPLARAWARDAWEAHDRGRYGPDRPPSRPFAVTARREGSVVGLAEGRTSGSVCELRRLMVGPSARGEGIGSKLLSAVESLAAERGCATCRLRTEAGGPAQAFYQGRGWVERGRLPDWRNGTDFARMERRLG